MSVSEGRALAAKVGKWLETKGRGAEAVAVLTAWAVLGPSDAEGQQLLAAALRISSGGPLTKQAFEQMEGMATARPELEAACAQYTVEALKALEAEMNRPVFRKAQVGYNNNLKYKNAVYHVQTEDSGLDRPHVITHLFADGGRIIKSIKRSYEAEVQRPDVTDHVKALMKAQQMEMVIALRDGKFDGIIEGRERGGMEVLETPPDPNVVQRATKPKDKKASPPAATPAPPPVAEQPIESPVLFRLHVVRGFGDSPDYYDSRSDYAELGSAGSVKMVGERFCHPREAALVLKAPGELIIDDFDGGNGAFVRIRRPVELQVGDEFIIGDQLLRIERNPTPDDEPDPAPTYCYSSPRRQSPFRVVQIFEGGALGACVVARGTTLQIGSAWGDMVLRDPLVSEQHCLVDEQAGVILLTDLGSRTGVFVRVQGETRLAHGDELLIGRTRLVVDLHPTAA